MKQTIPICLLILIIAISYMIYKKREQFMVKTTTLKDAQFGLIFFNNIKRLKHAMVWGVFSSNCIWEPTLDGTVSAGTNCDLELINTNTKQTVNDLYKLLKEYDSWDEKKQASYKDNYNKYATEIDKLNLSTEIPIGKIIINLYIYLIEQELLYDELIDNNFKQMPIFTFNGTNDLNIKKTHKTLHESLIYTYSFNKQVYMITTNQYSETKMEKDPPKRTVIIEAFNKMLVKNKNIWDKEKIIGFPPKFPDMSNLYNKYSDDPHKYEKLVTTYVKENPPFNYKVVAPPGTLLTPIEEIGKPNSLGIFKKNNTFEEGDFEKDYNFRLQIMNSLCYFFINDSGTSMIHIIDPFKIGITYYKDKFYSILKELSECMLENGDGWKGVGERQLNSKKKRANAIQSAITAAKQKTNKQKTNKQKPNKQNTNCDDIRTKLGIVYNIIFILVKSIPKKGYDKKKYSDIITTPKIGFYFYNWLHKKKYLILPPLLPLTEKISNYFSKNSFVEMMGTNEDIIIKFFNEFFKLKKKIVTYINSNSNIPTWTLENTQTVLTEAENASFGVLLSKGGGSNKKKRRAYEVARYLFIMYDILSDPLEKCKCMNIG